MTDSGPKISWGEKVKYGPSDFKTDDVAVFISGPYTFTFGLITYLLSKEIWVVEHDFGYVMASVIIVGLGHKLFGKQLANYLDKEIAVSVTFINTY